MYNQHMLKPIGKEVQMPSNVVLVGASDFELDLDTDLVRYCEVSFVLRRYTTR